MEGWAIVASFIFILYFKSSILIFESYLLSTIIIDELNEEQFSVVFLPISKINYGEKFFWCLISFIALFLHILVIQIFIRFMAVVTESSCIL